MNDRHPDLVDLDAMRADGTVDAHVGACPKCRETLAHLRELAGQLAGAPRVVVPVPTDRREAIREDARRALRTARKRAWVPLAAAAAILLALLGLLLRGTPVTQPGDVDRSGSVDIVDAYALAMAIRSGDPVDPGLDLTGDGRVDGADVDEIARRCVRIEGGRP